MRIRYTTELIADILRQTGGMTQEEAIAKASAMSRQYRRQIWLKAQGSCLVCGRPRGKRADRCDRCAKKLNAMALAYYYRKKQKELSK